MKYAARFEALALPTTCLALSMFFAALPALANQTWLITNQHGTTRRQTLDVSMQIYDLQGNLLSTISVQPPYLYTTGSLVVPLANSGNNVYVGRGNAYAATVANTPFPISTLPQYLELDGRWYTITVSGFVNAFFLPGDFSIDAGSWSNCRQLSGDPLPIATSPRLRLGNGANGFTNITINASSKIRMRYLTNGDVWSVTSAVGVVCDGAVGSPIDPVFSDGWESL